MPAKSTACDGDGQLFSIGKTSHCRGRERSRPFPTCHQSRGGGSRHLIVRFFLILSLLAVARSFPAYAGLCIDTERNAAAARNIRTAVGDQLRLSFKHSIYGSAVVEIFTVREAGFQLTQLHYSEQRLVEFYGYEQADFRDGVWVVRPEPTLLRALNLSVSDSSKMKLTLHSAASPRDIQLPSSGALRISVARCQ